MKKVKAIIWLIILTLAGLLVYQNEAFFMSKQVIIFNMYVKDFKTMPVPVALLFLISFLLGVIIAFILGLSNKFKIKKEVKSLKTELNIYKEKSGKAEKTTPKSSESA